MYTSMIFLLTASEYVRHLYITHNDHSGQENVGIFPTRWFITEFVIAIKWVIPELYNHKII